MICKCLVEAPAPSSVMERVAFAVGAAERAWANGRASPRHNLAHGRTTRNLLWPLIICW